MSITRSFKKQKWIFFENILGYFSLIVLNNQQYQQLILKTKVRVIEKKKMTGETPEVRSDKSLTLLTFNI